MTVPEVAAESAAGAPLMAVRGDTPIAQAVLSLGSALGYNVVPFESTTLDGAAAVVLADHGGPGEQAALLAALQAQVPYVGLIASRQRGADVLAGLDLAPEVTGRVHTPAGLDIGARTPEEVALAILAEIVASRPREPGDSRAGRGKATCQHPPLD